ncbi:hypothetical protein RRF57_010529 [Xylaria bambusicola]|uniref:Uncharacterized protein n=1 Tax=Xylaria bambusicola TaxID=326684 RepID=A0AAN7UXA8_9PEZI
MQHLSITSSGRHGMYSESDPGHTSTASLEPDPVYLPRTTSRRLARRKTMLLTNEECLCTSTTSSVRSVENETLNKVYQKNTTGGREGCFRHLDTRAGIPATRESSGGAGYICRQHNSVLYHVWMGNYT